nr:alpha/beta fold hydrolase [Clostridia bacterium]
AMDQWLENVVREKQILYSEDGYRLAAMEFRQDQQPVPTVPGEPGEAAESGEQLAPATPGEAAESGEQPAPATPGEAAESSGQSMPGGSSHNWVILLHGYTGWKEEMYPFAFWYFTEKGYNVLAPDLRCQGWSDGDFIGMGYTDRADVLLWIGHILEIDPQAWIILHGQSMGAACALMMTGLEELPDCVMAVVADCAYTDAYSMFRVKIGDWFHLPAFPLVDSACLMLKLRGGYDLKKASALEAVKVSETPTLFIHGTEDAMIPVSMSEEMYAACTAPKELLLVPGAGHVQSQDKDPDAYYGAVADFLAAWNPE